MRGFLRKVKAEVKGFSQCDEFNLSSINHNINEPTPLEIIRYRYHHATNLGSIYVIERWLQPSRFPDDADGSSELACVKAWVERIGIEATKQKFEEHWASAVSDEDIKWLQNNAKVTTIRLPIGYFDLPHPKFTQGTPFEPYSQVYSGAWQSICTLISRFRASSIGVLLDLHALPGGANAQEHSGTNSGRADLWTDPKNRALGVRCCEFLAQYARTSSGIAGIQLVNEAEWNALGMYEWYDECIAAISRYDSSVPVMISDGWNLNQAVDWSLRKNSVSTSSNPVVISAHYYWAFTDEDKRKSPQQIIGEVWTKLDVLNDREGSVADHGSVQVIVGEYSCVLTEDSWANSGGVPKEELVKQFGQTQSQRWQQRAGGSFFWTWKMDWMPGGEWGFKAQTDIGNIVPPSFTKILREDKRRLVEKARNEREQRKQVSVHQHIEYWKCADPKRYHEHEKYIHGWEVGYQDALTFFEGRGTPGDKIGMLEIWVLKRVRESGYHGGSTWLFEHGLRKGIKDFYVVVGI